MPKTTHQTLSLAGFNIQSMPAAALSGVLQARMQAGKPTALLFANTNFVLQCQELRTWVNSASVVLVNDGVGLDIAAKIIHGQRFFSNLNGTDFLPFFLKSMASPCKVFLYGGKPGVAEKAAEAIEVMSTHTVVGCCDGYARVSEQSLREHINASGADIVLVAMGNPLQEHWIHHNLPHVNASLCVGVGAFFDFMAGGVKRAPLWVQRIRFEWAFRLMQEPRRLMKRYSLDVVRFLWTCLRYRT